MDSRCKGFNSVGWYKTVVSPTTPYLGLCFYVKITGSDVGCLEGYDVRGRDLVFWVSVVSRAICREICRLDPRCVFFIYNQDAGTCMLRDLYLEGNPGTTDPFMLVRPELAACLGSTNFGQFYCVTGYDVNGDHVRSVFYAADIEECRVAFFLFLTDKRRCVLKKNQFNGVSGSTGPLSLISYACFRVY
ncbi:hypothetical protein HYH03_015513 [Edaphochlamys debaryana]|uniref:Apple domain-containing protein n=1 Tax=Edaphochlamys debaryana TaxID=47281 RepID=A0A836BR66_9CHLO|nr:hypothetical protein HYH03_015513 [Edaphochlamys debaryana]|eukprot:KAG2485802.1 hypothetical protein HYH03_015513 [Edaphochlamys debaryana]